MATMAKNERLVTPACPANLARRGRRRPPQNEKRTGALAARRTPPK